MNEMLFRAIRCMVAIKLNRVDVSWDEVEAIYASGKYPDINEAIDYIVGK